MIIVVNGLNFVETCHACPEQYDVFDDHGNLVGYVRLRHGGLYAECPYCGGEMVYEAYPEGDGCFIDEMERSFHLNAISEKIIQFINRYKEK